VGRGAGTIAITATTISAEKPDHQINTDHGHDMVMG
jgi:hypothetical protein